MTSDTVTLFLDGHYYRYDIEQSLLAYFPDAKPRYAETREAAEVVSVLRAGEKRAEAVTTLNIGGQTARATARAAARTRCDGPDRHERDRLLRHCVKLSFYRAAKALTGERPPWGALTGIRPAKLISQYSASKGVDLDVSAKYLIRRYDVTPARAALALAAARAAARASEDCRRDMTDISLYVGIPFCPTRCAYCSFISHDMNNAAKLMAPYTAALEREIEAAAQTVKRLGLRVACVYVGGGTPTALPDALLARILDKLAKSFDFSGLREYTAEAGRPDTFTPENTRLLRDFGVDRVSINPQSMNPGTLAAIGRRHTPGDVYAAFELASAAGFRTVNMDIIAGLPAPDESGGPAFETPEAFARTVDELLRLTPHNLTVHTLSRKRGSRLAQEREKGESPHVGEMLDYALKVLPRSGYQPYYLYRQKRMAGAFENTGWTKAGHMGYYNIAVMEELQTILSVGAGGVTKLVCPKTGLIRRRFNHKYPAEYIAAPEKTEANLRAAEEFYHEYMGDV